MDPTPAGEPTAEAADGRTIITVVAVGTNTSDTVVSAGGYVSDVIEVGGTCSFVLTQGTQTVSGSSAAEPDATVTWCPNVDLTLPQAGQPWALELSYESPMSVGTGTVTSEGGRS